jgi:hypothetical protein
MESKLQKAKHSIPYFDKKIKHQLSFLHYAQKQATEFVQHAK